MATISTTITITEDSATVMSLTKADSSVVSTVRETVQANTGGTTYTIPTDIGNVNRVSIRNLDTSNFVDVSLDGSANNHVRVGANTISSFGVQPTLASFDLTADTANCNCVVHCYEA